MAPDLQGPGSLSWHETYSHPGRIGSQLQQPHHVGELLRAITVASDAAAPEALPWPHWLKTDAGFASAVIP